MIFWVTLISPPVRVLNVEQSESLQGCPSEPTTARFFYSDIKSAGAVLLATQPFEDSRRCPQQLMQGHLLRRFKNEMQMGELIDEHGGEF